jgi:ABC-type uncharacterized transport system involved in gliding motility auxiliary subunit
MSNAKLKQYAPLGVALGLGGLVVAGFIFLYQRKFDVAVQSSLAVAALGFAVALLLNPGALQTWLGGRQARYGGNVLAMTVAFIGIVGVVNYLVYKNNKQWDLTEGQANTLAPETLEAIKQLPQPVKAIGFYSQSFASSRAQAETLLKRYQVAGPGQLTYEFHDPLGEPTVAQQYGITRDGTLILQMGDQKEELSFASEQEITGALIRFSHPTKRGVYFITSHGERDITSTDANGFSKIADLLKKQNYDVQPLNLQVTTTVPADARAVVVAGPLTPLTADEVTILGNYLRYNENSALVVLLDSQAQAQTPTEAPDPLVDYLGTAWGLNLPRDVVVDFYNSYPNQPLFPLNNGYESSPITDKLQKISSVFPVARSIVVSGTAEILPDITYTPLVKAEPRAWGETDFTSLKSQAGPQFGAGDTPGPLNLAVAAQDSKYKARLVVFGDSDFASNNAADQGANAQLLVNSINWATADESLINLTAKTPTQRTIILTDALTINLIFLIIVIILPLAVLVGGGVVWFIRRRHV